MGRAYQQIVVQLQINFQLPLPAASEDQVVEILEMPREFLMQCHPPRRGVGAKFSSPLNSPPNSHEPRVDMHLDWRNDSKFQFIVSHFSSSLMEDILRKGFVVAISPNDVLFDLCGTVSG